MPRIARNEACWGEQRGMHEHGQECGPDHDTLETVTTKTVGVLETGVASAELQQYMAGDYLGHQAGVRSGTKAGIRADARARSETGGRTPWRGRACRDDKWLEESPSDICCRTGSWPDFDVRLDHEWNEHSCANCNQPIGLLSEIMAESLLRELERQVRHFRVVGPSKTRFCLACLEEIFKEERVAGEIDRCGEFIASLEDGCR